MCVAACRGEDGRINQPARGGKANAHQQDPHQHHHRSRRAQRPRSRSKPRSLALNVYARVMRRGEDEQAALRALVDGSAPVNVSIDVDEGSEAISD